MPVVTVEVAVDVAEEDAVVTCVDVGVVSLVDVAVDVNVDDGVVRSQFRKNPWA
jgi:hypothetical protein